MVCLESYEMEGVQVGEGQKAPMINTHSTQSFKRKRRKVATLAKQAGTNHWHPVIMCMHEKTNHQGARTKQLPLNFSYGEETWNYLPRKSSLLICQK